MKKKMTWLDGALMLLFLILTVLFLYPFWHELVSSFASEAQLYRGGIILWPEEFSTAAYQTVFRSPAIFTAYRNTLWRTLVGTMLSVVVTFSGAYALSKRRLPFRGSITLFILFTMFFSGGLIPSYLTHKSLGLVGSLWVLVLPCLSSAWNVILARNFLMMQSGEIEESAYIDGAGVFRTFGYIVTPLSKPILAVLVLYNAVWHWNAWFDAYVYLRSADKIVLQLLLRNLLFEITADASEYIMSTTQASRRPPSDAVVAATIIVTIGPVLVLYPFLQRYFVKGIFVGSLKG